MGEDVSTDPSVFPADRGLAMTRSKGFKTQDLRPDGGGIEMVAEPEFEHHEGPEPLRIVAASLNVLVDQPGDRLGLEEAAPERDGVEEDRVELGFQLAPEPS